MSDNKNNIPEQNDSDIISPKDSSRDIDKAEETNDMPNEAQPSSQEQTAPEADTADGDTNDSSEADNGAAHETPEASDTNDTAQEAPEANDTNDTAQEAPEADTTDGSAATESENAEATPAEENPTAPEELPTEEKYAFEWNYTNLGSTPPTAKPKRKRTGLVFGLVMSGVFAIALLALVASIIFGIMSGKFSLNTNSSVDFNTQIQVSDTESTDDPRDATTDDLEDFKHSTVVIICDSGTGTGIILDDNGMIVTNHHVIEDATTISVYLYDGRNYSAKLIGSDEYNDIAVIKIDATNLSPATFANSDNVETGERVYAVGTPAGPEFAWSITAGIVSHPSRELKFYNEQNLLEKSLYLIQTDALVNPGNSGGPLINTSCEVIGVVSMRLTDEYVGIGFAIPTNVALPIIEDIIENYTESPSLSTSTSPQIGISGIVVEKGERFIMSSMGFKDIVTEDYYNRHSDKCKYASVAGIYVLGVTEGFDAYGKLQEGDIIIAANRTSTTTMEELKSVITSKRVGDTITITVVRDGEQLQYSIVLGKPIQ